MKNFNFNSLLSKTAQAISVSWFKSTIIATVLLGGAISASAADFTYDFMSGKDYYNSYSYGDLINDLSGGTCTNIAQEKFIIKFLAVNSISTTDIKPYIENESGNQTYFDSISCENNLLKLSQLNNYIYSSGLYYLVIPAGAVEAEDGTKNDTEIRKPMWQLNASFNYEVWNNKIIEYVTCNEGLYNFSVTWSVQAPDYDYMSGFETSLDHYNFYEAGYYNISAFANKELYDPKTNYSCTAMITLNMNVYLEGFETDIDIEPIRNENNEVESVIVTFPEDYQVWHGWGNESTYVTHVTSGTASNLMENYDLYTQNQVKFDFMTPISSSGTHSITIPEGKINHNVDIPNSMPISLSNTKPITKEFEIEEVKTTAIDGISADTTGALYDAYNTQGIRMATGVTEATASATLPAGIYILKSNDNTKKITVK